MTVEECESLPWHRIVAKDGYISAMNMGIKGQIQKQLLLDEGYTLIGDNIDPKHMLG